MVITAPNSPSRNSVRSLISSLSPLVWLGSTSALTLSMVRMTRLSGRQASSNSPLPFLKYNLELANLLPSSFSYFLNYKTKPLSYEQWTQHLNTCNCCDGSTFIFFGLPGPAVTLSSSSAPTLVPGSSSAPRISWPLLVSDSWSVLLSLLTPSSWNLSGLETEQLVVELLGSGLGHGELGLQYRPHPPLLCQLSNELISLKHHLCGILKAAGGGPSHPFLAVEITINLEMRNH